MDQVKVYYNTEIKRTTIPATYSEFQSRVQNLFNIQEKFSVYFLNEKGEKSLISEDNFKAFTESVSNNKSTPKLIIGEPTPEINNYSFNETEKKQGLPDYFFNQVQSKIDWGYNNMKTYYETSRLPKVVETVKTETVGFFDKVKQEISETFKVCQSNDNQMYFEGMKHLEALKFIRENYDVKKSDKEILESLQKSNGDINLALVSLF
jgi:hypothetical protein